ncbi:potassium channel subfamily K member 18-like isoform X1 [Antedon mediterranea]|uniref:potassium channel subfamily K member 18-like isoform X1 n=1 Tax=Antedon mediterranea TaxID=105859 RepID=UPI003AF952C5
MSDDKAQEDPENVNTHKTVTFKRSMQASVYGGKKSTKRSISRMSTILELPNCSRECRKVLQILLVNLGLFAFLIGYGVLGAAIFQAFEGPNEVEEHYELCDKRTKLIEMFANLTNITLIESKLVEYEESLLGVHDKGYETIEGEEMNWNFFGSLFFASTVITTIGYGNLAPVTRWGRGFCMIYAVFGIALLLLVLASIGSLLAKGATMSYRYFKVFLKKDGSGDKKREKEFVREVPKSQLEGTSRNAVVEDNNGMVVTRLESETNNKDRPISPFFDPHVDYGRSIDPEDPTKLTQISLEEPKSDGEERIKTPDIQGVEEGEEKKHSSLDELFGDEDEAGTNIPLTAILLFAFIYMCLLAGLLTVWEDWDYFEALYFSFITLTTIGFGDLVPQHQKNLLACVFLIMVGMAVMSMCIALAQEEIMSKVRQIGKLIGVIITKRRESKRKK